MRRRDTRFRRSLAASVVVHLAAGLLLALAFERREPPLEEQLLTVELLSLGDEPAEVSGAASSEAEQADEPEPPTPPEPEPPTPPVPPTPPTPAEPQPPAPTELPQAPSGDVAAAPPEPTPAEQAPQPPPRSFSSWREQRMQRYAGALKAPSDASPGGGSPDGRDAMTSHGRDRCEPAAGRRVGVVFLLFDSSGSMDSTLRREALTCAHQYAKAAIDRGAEVIVGNFARSTVLSPATRSLTDVEFALRGGSDPYATLLPSNELNPFVDANVDAAADLVMVSDGYISNYRDVMPWYRYFLDANPENRGYLYTVGVSGHPDVVRAFRSIGFDVYVYRVMGMGG